MQAQERQPSPSPNAYALNACSCVWLCACVRLPAALLQVLRDADMVLAINGQPVSSFSDAERMIAEVAAAAAAAGQQGQQQEGQEEQPPAKRVRVSEGGNAAAAASAAGSEQGAEQDAEAAAAAVAAAAAAAGAAAQLPEVTLTIFRDGTVQEVAVRWAPLPALAAGWEGQWNPVSAVAPCHPGTGMLSRSPLPCCPTGATACRLGQEDGLGTNRLMHWCGAQLQVCGAALCCSALPPHSALPLDCALHASGQ